VINEVEMVAVSVDFVDNACNDTIYDVDTFKQGIYRLACTLYQEALQ